MRFHAGHRQGKSVGNLTASGYGARVGYWPCLRAPFIEVSIGKHRFAVWYGLPSYLKGDDMASKNFAPPRWDSEGWPICDWWVKRRPDHSYRCTTRAWFRWGDRVICRRHAAGWLRQGKTMTVLTVADRKVA